MKTFFAAAALVAAAMADNTPAPAYRPAPAPYQPAPAPAYKPAPAPYKAAPSYKEEPAQYQYSWNVQDDYAQLNYGQDEERNGYATSGSYRVALPDGRTQIVTYTVSDAYSGYVADVTYEGEAKYEPAPAYKPVYEPESKPRYERAYKPAPGYTV